MTCSGTRCSARHLPVPGATGKRIHAGRDLRAAHGFRPDPGRRPRLAVGGGENPDASRNLDRPIKLRLDAEPRVNRLFQGGAVSGWVVFRATNWAACRPE